MEIIILPPFNFFNLVLCEMKVNFQLRKEKINANGLIPVHFVVRYKRERIRKIVGISV